MKHLLFLLFFGAFGISAQNTKSIHFKKDKSLIYFFQVDKKSDTIMASQNDRFLLLVPDSMKENLRIDIDNAKIDLTGNDSIVKLIYIPGLRYEVVYTSPNTSIGSPVEKVSLKVQVNGTAQLDRQRVRVQFIDRRTNKVILENNFQFGN